MRLRLQSLIAILVLSPAVATAQVCMGTAPFSTGPLRAGLGAQFTEGAKMFGGSLAVGADGSAFAGVNASRISFDDLSETATMYGGHAGIALPVGASGKGSMCPFVAYDLQRGPNLEIFGSPAELSGSQLRLGLSVGGVLSSSPTADVIPYASLAYLRGKSEMTFSGTTESFKDDMGAFTVGAGWVLNKVVTINPSVAIPFGSEDDDAIFAIALFVNFGGKK